MVLDKDGKTDRTFKGMITSIEAENVKVRWDDGFAQSIRGAKLGVVFGEEETENTNTGLTYWRTVPRFFCTCEDIRTNNYRVPKKKPLPKETALEAFAADVAGFKQIEEDIPF